MKYKLIFKSGKKRYLRHFLFMMTQIINKIWRTLHQQCHQLWIKQQQSVNKSSWSVEESKNFGRGQEVYYLDSWILLVMAWNCLSVVRKSIFCSSYLAVITFVIFWMNAQSIWTWWKDDQSFHNSVGFSFNELLHQGK